LGQVGAATQLIYILAIPEPLMTANNAK